MTKPGKNKETASTPSGGDALFEAAMRGAKPLQQRPAKPPMKSIPASEENIGVVGLPAVPVRRRLVTSPGLSGGGLDKRSADRLRRGQMRIEGRLDLHGLTQADAHRAAHAFVLESHRAERRCILIITGKGGFREGGRLGFMPDRDIGVLRRNLPRWLAEPPVRQMVLHLEPARPQHGGDGAFYVLLRRKR